MLFSLNDDCADYQLLTPLGLASFSSFLLVSFVTFFLLRIFFRDTRFQRTQGKLSYTQLYFFFNSIPTCCVAAGSRVFSTERP